MRETTPASECISHSLRHETDLSALGLITALCHWIVLLTNRQIPRTTVLVYGIDKHFQADLVDVTEYLKENDSVQYPLTFIDVFSTYANISHF